MHRSLARSVLRRRTRSRRLPSAGGRSLPMSTAYEQSPSYMYSSSVEVDPAVIASYPNGATTVTDAEISLFSDIKPTPVSLRQILETTDPYEAGQFLHSEFPVRCAERIRMIESIPTSQWVNVPELVEAHGRHVLAFWRMRAVSLDAENRSLDAFTEAVRDVVRENVDMTALITKGMTDLYRTSDEEMIDSAYVDNFLNTFLLNRLGSNVLLKQYLAVVAPGEFGFGVHNEQTGEGIIDPECDVARLCRETARSVGQMCKKETDRIPPPITVEAFSASSSDLSHNGMATSPTFSFIPPALGYILRELLKNSCRATVDACRTLPHGAVRRRPVSVTVSADDSRMMICVADRGGGIPFDRVPSVWSYLHSTTRKKWGDDTSVADCDPYRDDTVPSSRLSSDNESDPTELAGYGIGLPMSRLYARYLGGDLNLISLPGYGTHAYVFLPRLSSDQIETFQFPELHRHRQEIQGDCSGQSGHKPDFVL